MLATCFSTAPTVSTSRSAIAERQRCPNALVAEGGRQPNVDDRDVRALHEHRRHERGAVRYGADDLEPVVAQEPRQPVAEQREVLRDHDAHGITALTVVGP